MNTLGRTHVPNEAINKHSLPTSIPKPMKTLIFNPFSSHTLRCRFAIATSSFRWSKSCHRLKPESTKERTQWHPHTFPLSVQINAQVRGSKEGVLANQHGTFVGNFSTNLKPPPLPSLLDGVEWPPLQGWWKRKGKGTFRGGALFRHRRCNRFWGPTGTSIDYNLDTGGDRFGLPVVVVVVVLLMEE